MVDETVSNSTGGDAAQEEWPPSARYASLGLIANPFALRATDGTEPFIELETAAQTNRLLGAVDAEAGRERPRVIWVDKAELPPSYHLQAVGHVERALIRDESLNLLHAYIQLAMMRTGRIRAVLQMVSERLAMRHFDEVIFGWTERVLAEPDAELSAYGALGTERLAAVASEFRADPLAVVHRVFGEPEFERHIELTEIADLRPIEIENVSADDAAEDVEIEPGFREAPGVSDGVLGEAGDEHEAEASGAADDAFFDYVREYTAAHLSPVVARALSAYRVRGTVTVATELTITKAPRKTLAAVLTLARCRYRRVVALFDSFEAWPLAETELRSKIIGSLSEVRSLVGDDMEMVFLVEHGLAPELEEQFGHGVRVTWDFGNLGAYFDKPSVLSGEIIDSWLESAALPGAQPMTAAGTVLSSLLETAEGSLTRFAHMASAAIENAADRGLGFLDDEARRAGIAADVES